MDVVERQRQVEVEQVGDRGAIVEQDVPQREVAVQDAVLVQVAERVERLHQQLGPLPRGQLVLRDRLEQRHAHARGDEQVVVGDRRDAVDRQEAGV